MLYLRTELTLGFTLIEAWIGVAFDVPTIFDIAKKAGVSITTVSRALNGYSDVSPKTRMRIREIATELNYYPNAVARSLQGKKTNTIAFAPLLGGHVEARPFFKEFMGVLALSCYNHELSLLVTVAETAEDITGIYRELAGSGRVDGLILADIGPRDERIALLNEIGLPFVAFGRTADYEQLNYPFVDVDGAAGSRILVNYLYAQGHRRIAYLTGPFNTSYALYRYNGYRQSLAEHTLAEDTRIVQADLQSQEQTSAAVARLLSLPPAEKPTAFVCGSDQLAFQVMHALRAQGRPVGRDWAGGQIAVSGFDDLPFAAYLQPGLTTLRQPMEETCAVLLDLLVALMQDKAAGVFSTEAPPVQLGPQQLLLQPALIIRESA